MGDHHHMEHNMEDHINHSNMNNGMNQMVNEHPHEHSMTDSILNAATDMNIIPSLRSHKHSMHGGEHTGHSMSMMTFHGGCMETILFSWWKTDDVGAFIGSFIAIFIMALLYEGLKYYRKHLLWKTYTGLQYCAVSPPDKNVTNICATDEPQQVIQPVPHVLERNVPTMLSAAHGFQTGLHGVQVLVSYMLMLVFMTYNTWLCAAVVLGSATGYFLFGWRESVVVDFTEHCH